MCFFNTGVHLVANIGLVRASLKCCLIGSFIGVIWLYYDQSNVGASTLFSTIVVNLFGLSSKPYRRPHKSKCRRLSILCVCGAVYLLLWGSALYFNATVTTSDGEEVPLREAISNFFKSPAWVETKQVINTVWEHIKANGWRNVLGQIIDALDPLGESNAYRVSQHKPLIMSDLANIGGQKHMGLVCCFFFMAQCLKESVSQAKNN